MVPDFTILHLSPNFFQKNLAVDLKKKNPFHPSKLCIKFGKNLSRSSRKEDFKICQCILTILQLSPLLEGCDPSFEKNLNHLHPAKDDLCQVWLKMTQLFWKRRFLKLLNVFLLFSSYLPFGRGMPLYLKNFNSLHQGILCANFD